MVSKNENIQNQNKQLQIPIRFEQFVDKVPSRFREGEFDEIQLQQVDSEYAQFQNNMKKQKTFTKRFTTVVLSAAASVLLFAGTGFVSPAVAKMLGKIPTLSHIYKLQAEDPYKLIEKELKKQGYPVQEMTEFGGSKGGYYIFLNASDEEVSEMKKGIEKTAFSILHSKNYEGTTIEDYFVRVRKYKKPSEKLEKENERLIKEDQEIFSIITPVLMANSYDFNNSYGRGRGSVELSFPSNESQKKIDDIKRAVEDALKGAGKEQVKVNIRKFNLIKQQQYSRWSDAISGIAGELKYYKKYKVSSVGYQSKDGTMRILIRLKMTSNDKKSTELAADLNRMVEEFIHTDEIWNKVKQDPYTIIISSKDGKNLNE